MGVVVAEEHKAQGKAQPAEPGPVKLVGLVRERKMLDACVRARKPALLIGDTGTGKTSLAKEMADEHNAGKLMRVNLNGGTTPDKLEGRFQLKGKETYFQYGVLVTAMKEGHLLLLDELNAALPDTLFVIHAVLEEIPRLFIPDTGEEFLPHPDFSVIGTMNPSHEYAGTRALNMALYSRFNVVVRFKHPMGEQLVKIVQAHHPKAAPDLVVRVVDVIDKLSALRAEEKINTPIGVREAISATGFASDGLTIQEALIAAVANKLDPMERKAAQGLEMLSDKAVAKVKSMNDIITLANDAAAAKRETEKMRRQMAKYDQLMNALKTAGLDTTEAIKEAAKEAEDKGGS